MKASSLIPATLSALLLSSPLIAAPAETSQRDSEHERVQLETKGVLGGIALGALAGGPAGAVLSAAAGGWFGNKLHEARESGHLKAELASSREALAKLQSANEELQQQLLASQNTQQANTLLASAGSDAGIHFSCCTDSELTLHFRSASSELEKHYLPALENFVEAARQLPEATIEISGHTDRRGASNNNLALSQQRVKAVETTLREMGLNNYRFRTVARGELQPLSASDNFEGNFFDRRVQVRLLSGQTELLTQHKP